MRELYAQRLLRTGEITQQELNSMAGELKETLERAIAYARTYKPSDSPPPVHGPWAKYAKVPKTYAEWQCRTGVEKGVLKDVAQQLPRRAGGFGVHPTVGADDGAAARSR